MGYHHPKTTKSPEACVEDKKYTLWYLFFVYSFFFCEGVLIC